MGSILPLIACQTLGASSVKTALTGHSLGVGFPRPISPKQPFILDRNFECYMAGVRTFPTSDFQPSLTQHRAAVAALRFRHRGDFPVCSHSPRFKIEKSKPSFCRAQDRQTNRGKTGPMGEQELLTQHFLADAEPRSSVCGGNRLTGHSQTSDCLEPEPYEKLSVAQDWRTAVSFAKSS